MNFNAEDQNIEYKSILKIRTGDKGFRELAETCVALANAQGGQIFIGIDDKTLSVGSGQTISTDEQNLFSQRRQKIKEPKKNLKKKKDKSLFFNWLTLSSPFSNQHLSEIENESANEVQDDSARP